MNREGLVEQIRSKKSFLCVGLDLDLEKMPSFLVDHPDQWLEFNKSIVDSTRDLCVAYKPNWAFYEALGSEGMSVLQKTIEYIGKEHFIIADAKRGDIGNTSKKYAKAIFQVYGVDAITVAPYMGIDSLEPFKAADKWLIILALTSNTGSNDFQRLKLDNGMMVYEEVLRATSSKFGIDYTMFVVGATHPEMLKSIRSIIPNHFLLVPGVGAQGGNLQAVCKYGMNDDVGLIVNSSRSIIYAGGQSRNYLDDVRKSAKEVQQVMATFL